LAGNLEEDTARARLRKSKLHVKEQMKRQEHTYRNYDVQAGGDNEEKVELLIKHVNKEVDDLRPFSVDNDNCQLYFAIKKDTNEIFFKGVIGGGAKT
jgi:uncharacterized FlaG/YvyC family protein